MPDCGGEAKWAIARGQKRPVIGWALRSDRGGFSLLLAGAGAIRPSGWLRLAGSDPARGPGEAAAAAR
jgi:hypothetical protein